MTGLKLGPTRFWRAMSEDFLSIYVTMASIIQGVALGVLVLTAVDLARQGDGERLGVLVGPFLLIVYVWFTYTYASLQHRYVLYLSDMVIFFAIGAVECWLVAAVRTPELFLGLAAVLSALGILDSLRVARQLDGEDFEDWDPVTSTSAYCELELADARQTMLTYWVGLGVFGALTVCCRFVSPTWGLVLQYVPGAFVMVIVGVANHEMKKWVNEYAPPQGGAQPKPAVEATPSAHGDGDENA